MNVTMDQLTLMSEDKAVDRWFDTRNYKWFVRLLICLFTISVWELSMITLDFVKPIAPMASYSLLMFACFILFLVKSHLTTSFQTTLIFFLFFQASLLSMGRETLDNMGYWLYISPVIFLFFRLKPMHNLFLYSWVVVLALIDSFLPEMEFSPQNIVNLMVITITSMLCMVTSVLLRAVNQRRFVAIWRIECNNRERLRMKKELDHARDLQLSMLPPSRPEIAHLDIACYSLPATEVGGDYYDYFKLSDKRLMLVIGDVSGHGVASGLVLSGVRSCLYMLEENLPGPAALLVELNRMLKKTTDKRMFMTFMAVDFDNENSRLIYSLAGHQPFLHYSGVYAELKEYPAPALPLGALMATTYKEYTLDFHHGDVFLFYTDGLTEAYNNADEEYGVKRLMKRFKTAAARGDSSIKIRDKIMSDVQLFVGETAQLDDMSLVIVRVNQKEKE